MLDKQYLATDLLTKDKHILRILVIDDEENINLFFKTCLKDQGFHVTFYSDALKAPVRLQPQYYDQSMTKCRRV
jgi:CheY-like chemotaxis protein